MFASLRRHPFAVRAHFRSSLVLAFAYPRELLQPLLPLGLEVDAHEGSGFVAIAMVQTERLRPALLPACFGCDFFLAGYRIFTRFRRRDGSVLRGLRILRSDTDRRSMVWAGNLFTGYRYRRCRYRGERTPSRLLLTITTPDGAADLDVRVDLATPVTRPPEGSPFVDLAAARRFAGPLPFTFGDAGPSRLVVVKGERGHWQPRPVHVEHVRSSFLARPPFASAPLRLANAFLVEHVAYRWRRGVVEEVPAVPAGTP